jgi:hypothetical protein
MKFSEFLSSRAGENTPAGDVARETLRDPWFPLSGPESAIKTYSHNMPPAAATVVLDLYREWQRAESRHRQGATA